MTTAVNTRGIQRARLRSQGVTDLAAFATALRRIGSAHGKVHTPQSKRVLGILTDTNSSRVYGAWAELTRPERMRITEQYCGDAWQRISIRPTARRGTDPVLFDLCRVNTMPEAMAWPEHYGLSFGPTGHRMNLEGFEEGWHYDRSAKRYVLPRTRPMAKPTGRQHSLRDKQRMREASWLGDGRLLV